MMWILIGVAVVVVVIIAFFAWMWYKLSLPLGDLDTEDFSDSTPTRRSKDLISREFEKQHSEALNARGTEKGQGAK